MKTATEASRAQYTTSQLCPFACAGLLPPTACSPFSARFILIIFRELKQVLNPLGVFYDVTILSPDRDLMTLYFLPDPSAGI